MKWKDFRRSREPHPAYETSEYAVKYLDHNIPETVPSASNMAFRVAVRNVGRARWYRDPPDSHFAGLAVYLDDAWQTTARSLRAVVSPGEQTIVCFTIRLEQPGRHRLKLDMVAHNVIFFSQAGSRPLEVDIDVQGRAGGQTEGLLDRAQRHNPWFFTAGEGTCTSRSGALFPAFVRRARGCRLEDMEGRSYIDYVMGWGTALLGYAPERIQEAIRRHLDSACTVALPHPLEVTVAERLCAKFPGAEMAFFGKNGSDACTAAVRMARAYTGRPMVMAGGYHGWQDWFAEQLDFRQTGIPQREHPLVVHFTFNDFENLKSLLTRYGDRVAAVLVEVAPIDSLDGPVYDADPNYLHAVAELARANGSLLIFDEILTGFRYDQGSVQQACGITPDLTCLGKALAAGLPLSAVIGRREILESTFYRIYYTPTFKGDVYALSAANEALTIYEEVDVPAHIQKIGRTLRDGLNRMFRAYELPAEVIGPPFRMLVRFLVDDGEVKVHLRTLLQQELARNRVITFRGLFLPCLAHDEGVVAQTLKQCEAAFEVMRQAYRSHRFLQSLEIPDIF